MRPLRFVQQTTLRSGAHANPRTHAARAKLPVRKIRLSQNRETKVAHKTPRRSLTTRRKKFRMECVGKTCCAANRVRRLPENIASFSGAGEGIRTPDPLITNQMLYRLSYASKTGESAPSRKLIPLIPSRCPGQLYKVPQREVGAQQTWPRLNQLKSGAGSAARK